MTFPLWSGNQLTGITVVTGEHLLRQGCIIRKSSTKHDDVDCEAIEEAVGAGDEGDGDVETEVSEKVVRKTEARWSGMVESVAMAATVWRTRW